MGTTGSGNQRPATGVTNLVRLGGRLAADPVTRVLPSGDAVTTFRLVVRRGRGDHRAQGVDTIDCAAWAALARRRVSGWAGGDEVEVEGSLRRRFWRTATGVGNRYEVEVRKAKRLRA